MAVVLVLLPVLLLQIAACELSRWRRIGRDFGGERFCRSPSSNPNPNPSPSLNSYRPHLSRRLGRDVSLSQDVRDNTPAMSRWQLDVVALERAAAEQESLLQGYQREAERQERRFKEKEEMLKEDIRRLERER